MKKGSKTKEVQGIQGENASGRSEAELKYAAVFDQSPDGILIIDAEGKIIDFNKAAHADLGYTREEFSKFSISDIDPLESPEEIRTHIQGTMRAKKAEFEVTHRTKSGELRNVLVITQTIALSGRTVLHTIWRDITDQKAAENRVGYLASILEHIPEGVCSIDMEGRIISWNEGSERMLGYKADDIVGRPVRLIMPKEKAREEIEYCIGELNRRGIFTGYETVRVAKGGGRVPVEISGLAIREDRKIIGYASIMRDITERLNIEKARLQDLNERKMAKEALSGSEKRLRAAFDNISVGASMADLRGKFIKVNRVLCNLLGYSEEELLSKTFSDITHPDDVQIGLNAVKQMVAGDIDHTSFEKRYIRKDGRLINVIISPAVIRDDEGKPLHFIALFQDITERKKMEEALRESENKFRSLFEQAIDGIMIGDAETKMHIEANKSICAMLGYTRDEIVGLSVDDIHPKEDLPAIRSLFERQLRGEISLAAEVPMLRKDGSIFYADINATHVTLGGRKCLAGIFRDITERKKAEGIMKSALSEKETLLRELYHRTKNNMQVITSLLNLQSQAIDDKKTLQILEDTKSRIHSMALVHEKLYKARDLYQVNLRDYIADLAASLMDGHQVIKGKISLLLDIDNIAVSIDTITPCGLVLNELMTNALKYAFPDGRAGKITISARLNAERIIKMRFCDDGVGLPERIDMGNPKSLGLKIVNTLVETQLRGKMVIERAHGTGFMISFKEMDMRERI